MEAAFKPEPLADFKIIHIAVRYGSQPSPPWGGEGGEPVRHSAANGPERSEGAQGKLREPGEGPAIFEALMKPRASNSRTGPRS